MQLFDAFLADYEARVEDFHPSRTPKRQRKETGSEMTRRDIDKLNDRYKELVARVTQKVDNILGAGQDDTDVSFASS